MAAVLKNKFLTVTIDELGAELTSVKSNDDQIEYVWQADPKSGETCSRSLSVRGSLKRRSI